MNTEFRIRPVIADGYCIGVYALERACKGIDAWMEIYRDQDPQACRQYATNLKKNEARAN